MSKNKNYTRNFENPEGAIETVETVEVPIIEPPTAVSGKVTGCYRLNVRSAPNTSADVLEVIWNGSSLEIYENDSNSEWYKVRTETGVEGFCMKQYVTK